MMRRGYALKSCAHHLRGKPRRDLHVLPQPQLSMRRPQASARPLLPADLEGGRQDRLPTAIGRRGAPLPGVDHQPPRAGVHDPPDARCLPPSRRLPPRGDGSAPPGAQASSPAAPLAPKPQRLKPRKPRDIKRTWRYPGVQHPLDGHAAPRNPRFKGVSASSESSHTQSS